MVGLTGGIGSGKSAVATRLAGLGATVIDSDVIAREVVAPGTEGLALVVAAFGERVRAADGGLDRPALGEIVFRDPAARARLEAIVHPRVRARTTELAAAAGPDAIVVNDVPLLVEVGLAPTYHLVIVVQADAALRIERLVRNRGMSPEEARRRIAAQASDEQRAAAADAVLTNAASLARLHEQVAALWRERLVPYERNVRDCRPAAADPVRKVPADPGWPAAYARLAARLRHALGDPGAERYRLAHVGPTSVPGQDAPDVIDIQLTVVDRTDVAPVAERLTRAGFPCWPDTAGAGDRQPEDPVSAAGGCAGARWWHGNADPGRPARLCVRVPDPTGPRH